jgi:hypothetical protein
MSRYRLLALLLAGLHFVLAAAYSVGSPLGEAPDEADHWAYVVYIARERNLPEGPRVTQSKHPPFYHATAALVAGFAGARNDFLRANPDVAISPGPTQAPNFFIHTSLESWPWRKGVLAFHLARLWSVFLSSVTVIATYGLARSALPAHPGIAIFATALVATLPEFAFIGGAVNNDNAAALFGTLSLWGGFAIWRAKGQWRAGWWTPLALGLGLLSKISTGSLWPIVGLLIVLGAIQDEQDNHISWQEAMRRAIVRWSTWVQSGVMVFLPALLIASPWLLRNWQLYGDPTGMALTQQTIDLRTTAWTWQETRWLLTGWFTSFWGKFGAVGHITYSAWLYWFFALITLIGIVGFFIALVRAPRGRGPLLLLAAAALAVALGMWRYSLIALGTDQGRLLFPAIGPLLVLLAVGLASWPWGKWRIALARALVVALALVATYGLVGVIRPAFAPPPLPTSVAAAPSHPDVAPLDFGEIVLNDWSLQENPTLYWRAEQQPTQDWRANLRITAEDGTLVWEWRRSPGYGLYSSDRWPAGFVVRDEYSVRWPEWAGPGRYRVEITLYPFGEEPGQAHPHQFIGWLEKTD